MKRYFNNMQIISNKYNIIAIYEIKQLVLAIATVILLPSLATGEEPKARKDGEPFTVTGDVLQYAIPASAAIYSMLTKDYEGLGKLALSVGTATAVTYGLKYAVGRPRPYQYSDERGTSFPSFHTASAFAGAAYWQRRYGWYAGIPAYALAATAGYSRVWGNYHYWTDVAAGAAIGTASAYIFTKPYKKSRDSGTDDDKLQISVGATASSAHVIISGRF
jgi:membrane-associated phospholipid phosphatase